MAPCALAFLLALLGALAQPSVAAVRVKRLRFDANWTNAENWSAGRPPTPGEVAVVDGPGGAMLDLPARTRVRALVLAREGALWLPRDGALAVLGSATGRDALENHFVRGGAQDWLDPEAWAPAERALAAAWPAVPHAQRVPCRWDYVLLPAHTSFALRLPPLPLAVALVIANTPWIDPSLADASGFGEPFERQRWMYEQSWLRLVGDGRFVLPPPGAGEEVGGVQLRGGRCAHPAGCACAAPAALAAAVERRVCAHQQPRCARAPLPPCDAPVQPRGHCCPLCGAFLELRVERERFRLVALQRAADRALKASGAAAQGVQAYAHALPDGRVQLVLVESDPYRGASVEAAYGLRASFLSEEALGVEAATLTAAGPPVSEHRWIRVAGPVLGTLAVALAAFAAIFLVFSGWRSLISCSAEDEGSFVFARFENVEADSEAVEVIASPLATSQSFDNPLYKEKGSEKSSNKMQYTTLQEEETTSDVAETSGFKRFDD